MNVSCCWETCSLTVFIVLLDLPKDITDETADTTSETISVTAPNNAPIPENKKLKNPIEFLFE